MGSTSPPQWKSILQHVKDADEFETALAGVGVTKQFVRPELESMEMARALRQAGAHPRRSAIFGKLHDVFVSAKRQTVSGIVARAARRVRFSQRAIYCGVNVAGDLQKVLQGGSAYEWIR